VTDCSGCFGFDAKAELEEHQYCFCIESIDCLRRNFKKNRLSGRTDFGKSTKTKELRRFASLSPTLRRLPDAADKVGFAAVRTSSAFASLPPLG
ncbi:MAG: hypothetical protein NTV87_05840, partial [Ignavibacteriae bacterium]|nr:hypothetical protein [Ignavibacteriota bacterium]